MVDMAARIDRARYVPDWKAIFHNILALSEIAEREFVACGNIVTQDNAVNVDWRASLKRRKRNRHVVGGIYLDILLHIIKFYKPTISIDVKSNIFSYTANNLLVSVGVSDLWGDQTEMTKEQDIPPLIVKVVLVPSSPHIPAFSE